MRSGKPEPGPRVRPINTLAPPPWYKVWGLDGSKNIIGATKAPNQAKGQALKPPPPAAKEAAKEAGKEAEKKEAWYKFW